MESTRYTVRVHGRLGPRSAPLGRMLRLGIGPRGGTPAAGPTFAAAVGLSRKWLMGAHGCNHLSNRRAGDLCVFLVRLQC